MKTIAKFALGALLLSGSALTLTTPAAAHVSIGIGIGAPIYPGYYPPGPCYNYNYYYDGDCGYQMYSYPIFLDGYWYNGPHYYRYYGGRPWVWSRGHWRADYHGGWNGHGDWHGGGYHGGGYHDRGYHDRGYHDRGYHGGDHHGHWGH